MAIKISELVAIDALAVADELPVVDVSSSVTKKVTGQQVLDFVGANVLPTQNPIINGNFDVWQRGTTFTSPASQTYLADRWKISFAGDVLTIISRSTDLPTVAEAGQLFHFSLEVDITTADASIAATDFCLIGQPIEGSNWRSFAQRTFTVSFWVMDTITGEHAVAFRNDGLDRSYVATYTVNSSDTWEYKSVTVTASPSAGTWLYSGGTVGLRVDFPLSVGSDYQTTAGAWQTGNYIGTATTVNSTSSASNVFRITGVALGLGAVPAAVHYRAIQDELMLCQRYYEKSFAFGTTPAQNIGLGTEVCFATIAAGAVSARTHIPFKVSKPLSPTVTLYNPAAANAQVRDISGSLDCSGSTANEVTNWGFRIECTGNAGSAANSRLGVHWVADAEL